MSCTRHFVDVICLEHRRPAAGANTAASTVSSTADSVNSLSAASAKVSHVVQGQFSIDLDAPELTVNAHVVPPVQLATVEDYDELVKFSLPQQLKER